MHSSSPIGDVSVGAAALATPVTLAHSPCFSSAIGVSFARRSAAKAWFAGSIAHATPASNRMPADDDRGHEQGFHPAPSRQRSAPSPTSVTTIGWLTDPRMRRASGAERKPAAGAAGSGSRKASPRTLTRSPG